MSWLLRLLLLLFVVRALWRLAKGVLQGISPTPQVPGQSGVALMRDPVCGVFVVPSRALTSGHGEAAQYFCSERCRQEYFRNA